MYRLVYVSTARENLTDQDMAAILDTAQSNNHERYLTGFLAHNGANFMQALEGEEVEVREVGHVEDAALHAGAGREEELKLAAYVDPLAVGLGAVDARWRTRGWTCR